MELAFSTLGCPEWTFDDVITHAKEYGYTGIEFRGLLSEIELTQVPEFSSAQIATTRQRLADAGLQATCLSSSVSIVKAMADAVSKQQAVATAERYIDMAKEVGAPFVRLFCGDNPPDMSMADAVARAAETLQHLGDFALSRGVTVVVETHDAFTETIKIANLVRMTNHPAVRVLWDIHHPFRAKGESIVQSMENLQGLIAYTHIKDSVVNAETGAVTYVPIGLGDVPVKQVIDDLQQAGYDGFITLEWEKRWHPELADPEIVFSHYTEQMRAWMAEL